MGALPRVKTAIIGGSGLYALAGLENARQISVYTPFGPPSDQAVSVAARMPKNR